MLDRTKSVLVNCAVAAVVAFFLFVAATQFRQWSQFTRGEQALKAGDQINAIAGFESAIHMYTPFSPLVNRAATRLWIIGRDLETRGESEKALIAYRALRSSFYATHGLFTPGKEWIAICDAKIRQLAKPVEPAR